MRFLDMRWMEDPSWTEWIEDEKGSRILIKDDAPDYAKESFAKYWEQMEEKNRQGIK